ncbi:unnamed protein product [Lactuca saligna]|uniref:Uncharacterized protein n=1 Tax=Lactuca saligna TaxID=75948 RepID=A0AA35ZRT2_LACSI|nr:unnamed protein product [Lactuca saligna]
MEDGGFISFIGTILIPSPLPTSPPLTSTILLTSIPDVSPNFQEVMNTIATFASSQSTEHEQRVNEDDILVGFANLEFNPKEDDVLDNAIISGIDMKLEEWLVVNSHTFNHKIEKLRDVDEEQYEILEKLMKAVKLTELPRPFPSNQCSTFYECSARGRKGVGSYKGTGEEKGVVVVRVLFAQIPTSLPMKPGVSITTTTIAPNINIDVSKLQTKKRVNIGEGASSKDVEKPEIKYAPIDKGKGVSMELSKEEKKKLKELDM